MIDCGAFALHCVNRSGGVVSNVEHDSQRDVSLSLQLGRLKSAAGISQARSSSSVLFTLINGDLDNLSLRDYTKSAEYGT